MKAKSTEGSVRTSTFTQAVGRIVRDNEEKLTDEEKEKITYYFKSYKAIGKLYKQNIADDAGESFLDTTRGFWYICDTSFSNIDTYKHPGSFELYNYGIGRGENYKVFLQPGIYFYFALAFLLYAIYKNEKNTLVIAILLFVFYASCYMANCSIVRYMYPVMVSTPIMLALVEKNKKEEENE